MENNDDWTQGATAAAYGYPRDDYASDDWLAGWDSFISIYRAFMAGPTEETARAFRAGAHLDQVVIDG